MNDLLQMHDIDKYYGSIKALDGAFLDVPAGEVHALLGVNGAGKSTLMKVLSGELSFEGGTVVFDGRTFKPGDKWNIADIGISMVHQEISTVPVISVACYMFLAHLTYRCTHHYLISYKVSTLTPVNLNIIASSMPSSFIAFAISFMPSILPSFLPFSIPFSIPFSYPSP